MKSKFIIFFLLALTLVSSLPNPQPNADKVSRKFIYCPDYLYFRQSCIKLA